ncbi:MAG TPA: class 1 fructose-bisphosphatase [Methylophilaceae bacterium]|nr:class 1 fructose-bisphosphatase [Methylophilaceae bacterium]
MSIITINEFVMQEQHRVDGATGELSLVIGDIVSACKKIALAVNQGALSGTMGNLESQNIQGEVQKELDVIANEIFLKSNLASGHIAGMASEEMDEPYEISEKSRQFGKYLLLFDPLDGSSNVNLNITVGTIFSVLRCPAGVSNPKLEDYLQPGTSQVCAGYALYGSSTMLVLTTGKGVNGFTLDHVTDDFLLTHPDMRIAADTQEFAINMSNQRYWEPSVKRYIEECLQGREGVRQKDFNMRWVGSMVAEVHRILIRGGVFIYPIDSKLKDKGGRLRLLYEANPMSFIVEQAGGASSTGYERIMEVNPNSLHQRVPVILGAHNEVVLLMSYHHQFSNNDLMGN